MARPPRIEYPDASYHIVNRGNRGQVVFHSDSDYRLFVHKLACSCEAYDVAVRAYCLMPNHFHLYAQTRQANLGRFMQSLLGGFAITFNRRTETSGHVFQGRYRAHLVDEEAYGVTVSRYVHLNPVRSARFQDASVRERRRALATYRWSSYPCYLGTRRPPVWLDRAPLLNGWGGETPDSMRAYAAYVEEGLLQDAEDPFEAASELQILGRERFVEEVSQHHLASRVRPDARRLPAALEVADVTEAVAAAYQVPANELLSPRSRHRDARRMLLYCASRYCVGARSLTSLAQQLGPISPGGLTRARDRVATALAGLGEDAARLEAIQERLRLGSDMRY
jgi:putative transposase